MTMLRRSRCRSRCHGLPGSLAALALLSTTVTGLVHAAPAAAVAVPPLTERYDEAGYGDFPAVPASVIHRHRPAPPSPAVPPAARESGSMPDTGGSMPDTGGSMADTGAASDRLWLLGALAFVLTAAGGITVAWARARGRDD